MNKKRFFSILSLTVLLSWAFADSYLSIDSSIRDSLTLHGIYEGLVIIILSLLVAVFAVIFGTITDSLLDSIIKLNRREQT